MTAAYLAGRSALEKAPCPGRGRQREGLIFPIFRGEEVKYVDRGKEVKYVDRGKEVKYVDRGKEVKYVEKR